MFFNITLTLALARQKINAVITPAIPYIDLSAGGGRGEREKGVRDMSDTLSSIDVWLCIDIHFVTVTFNLLAFQSFGDCDFKFISNYNILDLALIIFPT